MLLKRRTNNKVDTNTAHNSDIFHALRPFHLACKALMVAPWRMRPSPTNTTFTTTSKYNIFHHARCILSICLGYYALTYYINIATRLKVVQAILNVISITAIIPIVFFTRESYAKMFYNFQQLEKSLSKIGISCNNNKLFRITILQMICILVISVVSQTSVSPEFTLLRKWLLFTLFVIPNIITMMFLLQYFNLVVVIRDWLDSLNEYLKELLIIEFEAEKRLDLSRKYFHSIWELSQVVEKVFQLPVLVVMGITFINTAAFVYLWIIVNKINPSTYLWFFSNVLKISLLPWMCDLCRSKDVKIRVTLQKITSLKFGQIKNENNLNTLDFSMQLAHEKITFQCCSMFPLDLTWVFSMCAAVSIYVVIFLQNNVNG